MCYMEDRTTWIFEYVNRVKKELKLDKKTANGNKMVQVYVYDLLDKSELPKTKFYNILFSINKMLDDNIVLYLAPKPIKEE